MSLRLFTYSKMKLRMNEIEDFIYDDRQVYVGIVQKPCGRLQPNLTYRSKIYVCVLWI